MNWRPLADVEREATGELTLIAWRKAKDVAPSGYGLFRWDDQYGWIGTNTITLDHHPGFTPACEVWGCVVDSPTAAVDLLERRLRGIEERLERLERTQS